MGEGLAVLTTASWSYVNRIVIPGIPAASLGSSQIRELVGVWGPTREEVATRRTKDTFNITCARILPLEEVIKVHRTTSAQFQSHLRQLGKGLTVPIKEDVASRALPDYSGRISEQQVAELVSKIGVELEGGWDSTVGLLRTKPDGSVNIAANFAGEIAMPAHSPNQFPWETGRESFYHNYPQHVNDTCGMHVHMSFPRPALYAALVCREFTEWLLQGLELWGKSHRIKSKRFYQRIHGAQYCRREYHAASQLGFASHHGDRYTAVNYCLRLHGTVEFRMLPMFRDKEISRKAITELVRLVTLWLEARAPKARKPLLLGSTEYDTRELPAEWNFRSPGSAGVDTEGINEAELGELVIPGAAEFDPVSFALRA